MPVSVLHSIAAAKITNIRRSRDFRSRLVQQILQSPPIVQAALNLRHKLFRYVDGDATPIRATVQDITLMLFARLARRAILADAPAPPQAQRTQKRRPKIRRFTPQPERDI